MTKLNESERSILMNCSAGLVTEEDVRKVITRKATLNEVEELLDDSISAEDYDSFSAIFWHMPRVLTRKEECYLYRKYLLVDGHYEHENIVSSFQTYFNDDVCNIPYLMTAISNLPANHTPDDMKYPYIRKCIYAIGAQPEPSNFIALDILSESDDEKIKELALHQSEKRKNLGQWEKRK